MQNGCPRELKQPKFSKAIPANYFGQKSTDSTSLNGSADTKVINTYR